MIFRDRRRPNKDSCERETARIGRVQQVSAHLRGGAPGASEKGCSRLWPGRGRGQAVDVEGATAHRKAASGGKASSRRMCHLQLRPLTLRPREGARASHATARPRGKVAVPRRGPAAGRGESRLRTVTPAPHLAVTRERLRCTDRRESRGCRRLLPGSAEESRGRMEVKTKTREEPAPPACAAPPGIRLSPPRMIDTKTALGNYTTHLLAPPQITPALILPGMQEAQGKYR